MCYTGYSVPVANLTLVVDDDILRAARVRAAAENTSVNAVVRNAIAEYAGGAPFGSPQRARVLKKLFALKASGVEQGAADER
jgi:plasmid stability protein